jgi:hypothetical protein
MKKKSSTFTNFLQSPLWKKKIDHLKNELVLPYFMYFDDFVADNNLGTHVKAHSMAGVYFILPFLPVEIQSKLDNIFLMYLFKSKDKKLGNKVIFAPLIKQMMQLEEQGIDVLIDGKLINVKFVLGLILGDNLGLHEILGYVKSFSANFPCRRCKMPKEQTKNCFIEDMNLLRNEATNKQDIVIGNVSKTGIHESCVFNQIKTFNVWQNLSFDIMHDLLEGVFHYDLGLILKHFITNGLFTLENLNDKKNSFDYGTLKIGNLAEDITMKHLDNQKFNFTSSEMLCFVRNLPFMIGQYVAEDDEVWIFFLTLLKILNIVMDPSVTESNMEYLDGLVYEHHKFYCDFFKATLKPKHHFMIHYSTVMREIGPLKNIWCMRLEGNHKQLKKYASSITCRKNLALSIATKEQIKLSSRFFSQSIIDWNETCTGSRENATVVNRYESLQLPPNTKYFK